MIIMVDMGFYTQICQNIPIVFWDMDRLCHVGSPKLLVYMLVVAYNLLLQSPIIIDFPDEIGEYPGILVNLSYLNCGLDQQLTHPY